MRIETERLVLRPWREDDAETLFPYASDPEVGPAAGWAPHTSVEDSLGVLRAILIKPETWAITIKPSDEAVGSIGVFPGSEERQGGEREIGYWIAKPFWGRGYVPEAVRALLDLYFSLGAERIWCAHADFNDKSRRVVEKCGFRYQFTAPWQAPIGDFRNSLYYALTAEEFGDD
jgi:RimJ/RimL family protein N-acetyltransferase